MQYGAVLAAAVPIFVAGFAEKGFTGVAVTALASALLPHTAAAQKLLGVPDDTEAVSAAIARWNARELEAAGNDTGVVMPMLRSPEELFAEPHYREALADSLQSQWLKSG